MKSTLDSRALLPSATFSVASICGSIFSSVFGSTFGSGSGFWFSSGFSSAFSTISGSASILRSNFGSFSSSKSSSSNCFFRSVFGNEGGGVAAFLASFCTFGASAVTFGVDFANGVSSFLVGGALGVLGTFGVSIFFSTFGFSVFGFSTFGFSTFGFSTGGFGAAVVLGVVLLGFADWDLGVVDDSLEARLGRDAPSGAVLGALSNEVCLVLVVLALGDRF